MPQIASSTASSGRYEAVYDVARDLLETVEDATEALLAISDHDSALRPAPGKWSPREIIGHLIDSAANNHPRFINGQLGEDLVFPGYDQEEWVRVQRYEEAPWLELVELWRTYNRHLARVMQSVPEPVRTREHRRHTLHRIAWRVVAEGDPTTLDYLMRDYVAHLKHHLRQALPESPSTSVRRPT